MLVVGRITGATFGALTWCLIWCLIGCRELPAPEGGILSLSPIMLPSPGLVAGDTMRDSSGSVAPLRVTAYAVDGQPLAPQPEAAFVVLDTGAHLAGALLVGDSVGRTVRVVGTVGSFQTQLATVKVTALPDTLIPADSLVFRKSYSLISGDTVATSPDLSVLVRHVTPSATGVEAVIVNYSIDRAPTGNGQGPTVVLTSGTMRSSRDTTDASGRAARTARLRLVALSAFGAYTVAVSVTSSYRGRILGTVQFLVIYMKQ